MSRSIIQILIAFLIGTIGGSLFYLMNFPLPWVLGAMAAVTLTKAVSSVAIEWPTKIRNGGLIVLGIYFGLYFTLETFQTIGPYFLPYILATAILIAVSVFNSQFVTKWIPIDRVTSVFGSIPGGLTEMVIASQDMNARPALVGIFQTVRLITVLFLVPFIIVQMFGGGERLAPSPFVAESGAFLTPELLWFAIPAVLGVLMRSLLPAAIVMIPMATTAALNISAIELAAIHPLVLILAQITVGIGIGKDISIKDLKIGGKYCFVYFFLTLVLILVSLLLGYLLSIFTSLDAATAMLSIAPGGLIEMVLVASSVGADPAIVSALQLTRILLIIILVPITLKKYLK